MFGFSDVICSEEETLEILETLERLETFAMLETVETLLLNGVVEVVGLEHAAIDSVVTRINTKHNNFFITNSFPYV